MLCEENEIPVRSIVEVGTWKGATARIIRGLFPQAHLYLVDPLNPTSEYLEQRGPYSLDAKDYEACYQQVSKFFEKDPQVSILRKALLEWAKEIPDGIDLVFINADRSYEHVK